MAEQISSQPASPTQPQPPRRMSFTQRLVGNSKDLFSNYYTSHDNDDQIYGHGFNDQADDMIPAFMLTNANRRRNSSVSSEGSVDGVENVGRRQRQNSLTDRIAGMQLMRKPADKFEGFATTISSCVDDQ